MSQFNAHDELTMGPVPFAHDADVQTRANFIAKTYVHLLGAVLVFVGLEFLLYPLAESLMGTMLSGTYSWLIVLGMFMLVSWVARSWADSATSVPLQYAGLSLYVVAQAIIFVPLIYIGLQYNGVIETAALITVLLFFGLTFVVFLTRKDFSFLRGILIFAGIAALGLIVCSIIFGFSLGLVFSVVMVSLACGYILYDTSNVLHHYRIGQHVSAALALFASVALLFWYVLRIVIGMNRN